jgi:outer membrane protein OmpA-like peptidoglycan-associated protein
MMAKREAIGLGAGSLLLFAMLVGPFNQGVAQDLNLEQQILKALTKNAVPRMRGLTVDRPNPGERRLLDSIRGKQTRSITLSEREDLDQAIRDKPSIDVEISFDYGAANIGKAGIPVVTALGKALSNEVLKDSTIVIAGHTDSVGGTVFNQDLSERRADSIKRYLLEHFNLPADNLVTVGYGKSKPKNPKNTAGPENRRAQIVNME